MTTAEKLLRAKQDFGDVYSAGYEKGKAEGGGADNTLLDSVIDRSITNIESNVTAIGDNAFYKCSKLTRISFPNAVTVGIAAFQNCSFVSVALPNAVSVGNYCFASNAKLTTAEFDRCESFGNLCFYQDSKLIRLIIRSNNVATLVNSNAFNQTPIASGTGFIYVSDELVDEYKSATNWSTFADQIKGISELEGVSV